jgi:hypothetical protein
MTFRTTCGSQTSALSKAAPRRAPCISILRAPSCKFSSFRYGSSSGCLADFGHRFTRNSYIVNNPADAVVKKWATSRYSAHLSAAEENHLRTQLPKTVQVQLKAMVHALLNLTAAQGKGQALLESVQIDGRMETSLARDLIRNSDAQGAGRERGQRFDGWRAGAS